MGNACSQRANCTVDFDSVNSAVLALGGVERGSFEADPDIAGIGTVTALVVGTAVGLLVAFIITVGLVLDRIPKLVEFTYNHPVVRTLVPSPNQLLPRKDWPGTQASVLPSKATSSSVQLINDPVYSTHPGPPEPSGYDPGYSTYQAPPGPNTGRQTAHRPRQSGRRKRRHPPHDASYVDIETSGPRPTYHQQLRRSTKEWIIEKIGPERTVNYAKLNSFPERSYEVLEAMLFCIHDSQLLLAIALALSFHLGTNCSTSQYHLDIAMNLSIIGCVSFLLAFTLVRNYWASPVASGIRIGCFGVVMSFIRQTIEKQSGMNLLPEYEPPFSRNDSLILLDAVCFLNMTYSSDLNGTIGNQTGLVGTVGKAFPTMSYHNFSKAIIAASLCSSVFRLYQLVLYRTSGPARKIRTLDGDETSGYWSAGFLSLLWFGVWLVCCWIHIATALHVFRIREWVSNSGWIQPDDFSSNPENDVRSFGQIAAIVASGSIVLAAFDRWKPGWWRSWYDEDDE
ncbi:hypothetical protein FSARC_13923 [Fusarium sarcochroum]|uniref:Uncharacterized protein n=1 Tax=Fusarium sarcochroum TaxID=1208366 RepID=A0A8H4SXQ7_9HYPO|nr:hypothetical protein FSARC_13923 [Fusarium sarcochroum]